MNRFPVPGRLLRGAGGFDAGGVYPKRRLRLTGGLLAEAQADWAFFSPAVMYLYGAFRDGLWADLSHQLGGLDLFYCRWDQPVLAGLQSPDGDPGWNHSLFAVAAELWPKVVDFACGISLTSSQSQQMVAYGLQDVVVVDPLARERCGAGGSDALATIGAFGVLGSEYIAFFDSEMPPRLRVRREPDPATLAAARALYSNRNPANTGG